MGLFRLLSCVMLLVVCVHANIGGIDGKIGGGGGRYRGGGEEGDGGEGGDGGGGGEDSGRCPGGVNSENAHACAGPACSADGQPCKKTPIVLKCAAPPAPDCHFPTVKEPAPCVDPPHCAGDYEYRTIDGSCNNKKVSTWGMAMTPYTRVAEADYSDECCDDKGERINSNKCADISVEGDPFYDKHGRTCMKLNRIEDTHTKGCDKGAGDPLNKVTHFLDCSFVYGSDGATANSLRTSEGGKLKVQEIDGRQFPPTADDPEQTCKLSSNKSFCFKAGDERVNQHPLLSSFQTVFLRLHNKIVELLAKVNPHWDDEKLYQEGRRILIAVFQHIVYGEFLSIIIGKEFSESWHLPPKKSGHISGYDEKLNPATTGVFAASLGRAAHTLIYGVPPLNNQEGEKVNKFYLSDRMDDPSIIVCPKENFANILYGLRDGASAPDIYQDKQIVDYLSKGNKTYGDDLVAIDIQRNRDYGLPGCNAYMEVVGLEKAKDFEGFKQIMEEKDIKKLQQMYNHTDDVDLTLCLHLEKKACGSLVGSMSQRLLADVFYRWKYGDCWFYELNDCAKPFTDGQLKAIKEMTYSSLICTSANVKKYPEKGFLKISDENPLVSCDKIQQINLKWMEPWKESKD